MKTRRNRPVHIRLVLKDVLADIAKRVRSPSTDADGAVREKEDTRK